MSEKKNITELKKIRDERKREYAFVEKMIVEALRAKLPQKAKELIDTELVSARERLAEADEELKKRRFERNRKKYQAKKRAQGLCVLCDRPLAPGSKSLCQYHVDMSKVRNEARNERLKKQGRCPQCGAETAGDTIFCENCLKKRNDKSNERRAQGLCATCGIRPLAETSTWYCEVCLEKSRKRTRDRYHAKKMEEE